MRTVDTRPIIAAIEALGDLKEGKVDFEPVFEEIGTVIDDAAIQTDDHMVMLEGIENIQDGIQEVLERESDDSEVVDRLQKINDIIQGVQEEVFNNQLKLRITLEEIKILRELILVDVVNDQTEVLKGYLLLQRSMRKLFITALLQSLAIFGLCVIILL